MDLPPSTTQHVFSGPRGSLRVVLPGAAVVLHVSEGYLDVGLARHMIAQTQAVLDRVPLVALFHDWELVTGYESAARELLTSYVDTIRPQMAAAHILVRSRLVATGVAIANALLGGTLQATSSRPVFEAALREALARNAA